MSEPEMLSYVYAIGSRASVAAATGGLHGIADGPVRTVVGGDLAAVASSVPAAEFDDEGFRAQLEDLARLEAIARAHHAVVDHLAERTTVLPLRLATVYRDDTGVARMLEESQPAFGPLLERLEGRAEWGVKVYACPGDAEADSPSAPSGPAGEDALTPGRAYLRQRREQRSRHQDVFRTASEAAERIAALAAAYGADHVPHRPQSGELATGEGENVSNVSYLVDRHGGERFRTEAEEVCRALPGVRVVLTGPWAPYSFAEAPAAPTEGSAHGR